MPADQPPHDRDACAAVDAFVAAYCAQHPDAQVDDVYKLLYQAEFGVAHILDQPDMARRRLLDELDRVAASDTEPLVERIGVTGEVVRVHLRPFKHRRMAPVSLWDAVLESARLIRGEMDRFQGAWVRVTAGVRAGDIPLDVAAVEAFTSAMAAEDFPAVHHSLAFVRRYRPAYRVVRRDVFERVR